MLALRSTARNARSGRRAAGAHMGGPHSSRPLFTPSGSSFPFYPVHPSLFFFFLLRSRFTTLAAVEAAMMRLLLPLSGKRGGTSDSRGSPPRRTTVGAASCPWPRRAPPDRITAGVRRSLRQATHHGGTRQALHGGGRHFVLFFPFLVMSIILALHFFHVFLFYVFFSNWSFARNFFLESYSKFFLPKFCCQISLFPNFFLFFSNLFSSIISMKLFCS